MKKIAINIVMVFTLLVGMQNVSAQRPVGDTIVGADSTYMYYIYDWWRCANHDPSAPQWYSTQTDDLFCSAYSDGIISLSSYYNGPQAGMGTGGLVPGVNTWYDIFPGNNIRGVQMTTDHPIKIVGIAACAYAEASRDTTLWLYRQALNPNTYNPTVLFPNARDSTMTGRITDSLILYKPTNSIPECLSSGPWRAENAHRYIPIPIRIYGAMVEDSSTMRPYMIVDSTPVVAMYEVMFDKPQMVTDSFIVAGTSNNNDGNYALQGLPGTEGGYQELMWLWNHPPTRYWTIEYYYKKWLGPDLGITEGQYVYWFKYRHAPWMRSGRDIDMSHYLSFPDAYRLFVPAIFPIIDPDFDTMLCDVPRDVRLASATDTTLTLMWNGGNAVQWEVEYAEVNNPTSQTVTTNVPMVTLTGLRERTNYRVRVRAMCEWDTAYGLWSVNVGLRTGEHHDDPVSVSNLDRFTQMMPNPARGKVTLLSSYRLSRVVVYDLAGHAVLEQEDDGLATAFDVSGLAKGVYVVAIHTPAGIATKRLVVE